MKKLFILLFTSLILTKVYSQKTTLELNLENGETYRQISESTAIIEQDLNGQKINMEMSINGHISYLVTGISGDSYGMDVKYERLSMSMKLPQGVMEFSSEKNDESDMLSSILSEMKKHAFQITMTKQGIISEVKNIDKLYESAFEKFPQISEVQLAQLKTQIMKAYGEKAFKGNLEMCTAIYPTNSVSVGDSWNIKTQLEAAMAANLTSTYSFKEKNAEYNLIVGDSKISTEDKDAYIETNGMPMKYDLSGHMTSKIKVDKKSGWVIEAVIVQEISGVVNIKSNAQIPDGMEIPMTMKNNMKFTN